MNKQMVLINKLQNHLLHYILKAVFLSLLLTTNGFAQSNLEPRRGFLANNAYSISDIETINQSNGNLLLNIPLASLPAGRGGSPGTGVNLIYNSKIWNTYTYFSAYNSSSWTDVMIRPVPNGGGWQLSYGYGLEILDRSTEYAYYGSVTPSCGGNGYPSVNTDARIYIWKLRMNFPDGSSHEFLPLPNEQYNSTNGYGYWKEHPNGAFVECRVAGDSTGYFWYSNPTYTPRTYHTVDGSKLRLETSYAQPGDSYLTWTMYFPDGTRVTKSPSLNNYSGEQEIIDRNGNRTVINFSPPSGGATITDDVGRSITVNGNEVSVNGVGGEELKWTVLRKIIRPNRTYRTGGVATNPQLPLINVVDRVTLPQQLGALSYIFGYGANEAGTDPSGLGEVKSVTLPSGARAEYSRPLAKVGFVEGADR